MKTPMVLALVVGLVVGLCLGLPVGAKVAARAARWQVGTLPGAPGIWKVNRYTGEAYIQHPGDGPTYSPEWVRVADAP